MPLKNMVNSDVFPYDIETIAIHLDVPWAMDRSNNGRIYVTERTGSIWVIENGNFLAEPLITFEFPFVSKGEGGLMGIVLDPDFENNHFIYVMHTYYEEGKLYNRVVRLLEEDNKATINKIMIDEIPGDTGHNGGRIKIGPDGKLYIATGDASDGSLSQNINSMAGKILRINLDGSIPEDNPFVNSPVYSLGLRNPQGLTWGPNNMLYATDHGPMAHDEINIIESGENYGWPIVTGMEESDRILSRKPLVESGDQTWAPSGIAYINQGDWKGKLLVSSLRGEEILLFTLNDTGTEVINIESWLNNSYGRFREAFVAEDGSIYLTTSNRDGRGRPDSTDDKIIHLIPKNSNIN